MPQYYGGTTTKYYPYVFRFFEFFSLLLTLLCMKFCLKFFFVNLETSEGVTTSISDSFFYLECSDKFYYSSVSFL